jgi:hypothetical protein
MKRISYSGEVLVTGDEIADALVAYAAVLARADSSDSITIPTLTDSGEHPVTFLIGPASQIVVTDDEEHDGAQLLDQAVVDDLNRRARHVGPHHGTYTAAGDQPEASIEDFSEFG